MFPSSSPQGTLAQVLIASLLAGGLGTTLGALPIIAVRKLSTAVECTLAGFSAGVMLAASFVSLLLPSIELSQQNASSAFLALVPWGAGLLLGALAIHVLHRALPHEHFVKGAEGSAGARMHRVWLFAVALALHNLPEGMAVGVAVASGDASVSLPVTLGIAVQNVPEGLIVALAFFAAGHTKTRALAVTAATGLVEPIGAMLGWSALQLATSALPFALAFAAGAMLFVISHEVIPESHREGRSSVATAGLIVGVFAMLGFDVWLA